MPSYTVLTGQARREAFKKYLKKKGIGNKKRKKRKKRKPVKKKKSIAFDILVQRELKKKKEEQKLLYGQLTKSKRLTEEFTIPNTREKVKTLEENDKLVERKDASINIGTIGTYEMDEEDRETVRKIDMLEKFGVLRRKRAVLPNSKRKQFKRIVDKFETAYGDSVSKKKRRKPKPKKVKWTSMLNKTDTDHVHIFKEVERKGDIVIEQCSCGFHRKTEEM